MFRSVILITLLVEMAFGQPALWLKSRSTGSGEAKAAAVRNLAQSVTPKRWNMVRSHWIVQFPDAPTPSEMKELRDRGVQVLDYIPDHAFLVAAADNQDWTGLRLYLRQELSAGDKLSAAMDSDASIPVIVEFHRDVEVGAARSILAREGLVFRENPDLMSQHLLVEVTPEQAVRLAAWDEVAYIFPASAELASGTLVRACAGALTTEGPVTNLAVHAGEGWDGYGLNSADLTYAFQTLTGKLPSDVAQSELERAMAEWSRYVKIRFNAGGDATTFRHIDFLFAEGPHGDNYNFDGKGNTLAHTFYPSPPNPEPIAGDLHFDDAENWQVGLDTDLYSVALHELGHALGLGHSDMPDAVMYSYYRRVSNLAADDVTAIRTLYAARKDAGQPVVPASPGLPGVPTMPSTPVSPTTPVVPTPPFPTNPATPAAPAAPTTPVTPTTPFIPVTPVTPTSPATPTAPVTPAAPTPAAPTTPVTPPAPTPPVPTPPVPPVSPAPPATPVGPPLQPPPGTDRSAPNLTLASPTASSVSTTASVITLRGTATDNVGVAQVVWTSNTSGNGVAAGTKEWVADSIPLLRGTNYIVVRALDAAGNSAWRSVVVTRK